MQTAPIPSEGQVAAPQTYRPRSHVTLRILCALLSLLTIGIFGASIPAYYRSLHSICQAAVCEPGELTTVQAQELARLGISLGEYAAIFLALALISGACWCAVAAVIYFRGPATFMALFAALTLVTFGLGRFPDAPAALAAADPTWWLPVEALRYFGSACLSFFCYLFPDGKFLPRWTVVAACLWVLPQVPEFFFPGSPLDPNLYPAWLQAIGFLGFVASVVVAQVYRYRTVSSPEQRQQTKWVVWGLGVALTGFLVLTFALPVFLPARVERMISGPYIEAAAYAVMLLVPLSLGVAIVRHRLYDIDQLINRTLVYGLVTGILTITYFAAIVGLQSLVQVIHRTSQQSPLVIVASTLFIAGLFRPLRQRTQTVVDSRFYRRKYDAGAILENFSATLQNEIDLTAVKHQLMSVVAETMHPDTISLWLRQPPAPDQANEPGEVRRGRDVSLLVQEQRQ
jgi:hypothetical protein